MRWDGPILTDSGGFQVMSLSKLRKITDDGVAFQSHIDGAAHMLTPERAVEIQCLLGADIQMQLDECIALPATPRGDASAPSSARCAWAERCKRAFARSLDEAARARAGPVRHRAGRHRCRRCAQRSADALVAMDFPGYAIGGLAVGEAAGSRCSRRWS